MMMMMGISTGIPPVQCSLPLEPVIPSDVPDAIRFGTSPESRYEYSTFLHSVNTRYVSRVTAATRDWSKLPRVARNLFEFK